MKNALLIDCVGKDDRLNPYERIQRIGGPNTPDVPAPDASRFVAGLRHRGLAVSERPRWSLPLADAIRGILDGEWSFFIYFGAHQEIVNVEVAKSPSGCLYLKTEMDHDTPDELLFLPECRV
jgi:Protein of unknown function (DUF3892)